MRSPVILIALATPSLLSAMQVLELMGVFTLARLLL
jgi:hypothetical protein